MHWSTLFLSFFFNLINYFSSTWDKMYKTKCAGDEIAAHLKQSVICQTACCFPKHLWESGVIFISHRSFHTHARTLCKTKQMQRHVEWRDWSSRSFCLDAECGSMLQRPTQQCKQSTSLPAWQKTPDYSATSAYFCVYAVIFSFFFLHLLISSLRDLVSSSPGCTALMSHLAFLFFHPLFFTYKMNVC